MATLKKALQIAGIGVWGIVGLACSNTWSESLCPPQEPSTFCTLEPLGCETGGFDLAFSVDGRFLVTISDPPNNIVRVWDVRTFTEVAVFQAPEGSMLLQARLTPDNKRLLGAIFPVPFASQELPTEIVLWEITSGSRRAVIREHIQWIALSPDGKWLATASFHNNLVKIWDFAQLKEAEVIAIDKPEFLMFSPVDSLLIVSGRKGAIFDMKNKELVAILSEVFGPFAFSPDGGLLAFALPDGSVKLWDTNSWRELYAFVGHRNQICSLSFSHDGRFLASSAKDQMIKIWDVVKKEEAYEINIWKMFGLSEGYPAELRAVVETV
ncbi:PD40 domain-containing protein, partial [Candidatus Bipolaricaulota bacterium]|nr:PD40 domain-containing protein [Candidatus Bipolaricaulota bacterium]